MILLAIVCLSLLLMGLNANAPFVHANEDDNAVFGVGALQLAKFGFFKLKFGIASHVTETAEAMGTAYYANHPQLFIVPTALLYRFIGVSELTTRLSSIIFSALSLVAFYFAVSLFYKNRLIGLFSAGAYAVLPGLIFYSTTLSEKVFVIAFTNFLFLAYALIQRYEHRALKPLFLLVLVLGGFQGWHFFFAPVALWIYALATKDSKARNFMLITLPAVSLTVFAANFAHFYLLKGPAYTSIFSQFSHRSSRPPFSDYISLYTRWLAQNFTWPALLAAGGMFGWGVYRWVSTRKMDLFLLFLVQPLLTIAVFQEWTAHAFGSLYWAQFIALAIGLILYEALSRRDAFLRVGAAVLTIAFIVVAAINLNFYLKSEVVLRTNDTRLLKSLASQTSDSDSITLGLDQIGFNYQDTVEWYLQRPVPRNRWRTEKFDYVIAFNPSIGALHAQEFQEMQEQGYRFVAQGAYLLLLRSE